MQKLLLSEEEIFSVVETVWATSLGLPAELAARPEDSGNAEGAASAGTSLEVDQLDSVGNSATAVAAQPAAGGSAGAEMWISWVRISGGWEGAIALSCPPELARMAAVFMFSVEPDGASLEDAREALAELTNIVGGNLKALLPPPCHSSLPMLIRGAAGIEWASRASKVAELWASCLGWRFSIALLEFGETSLLDAGEQSAPSPNRRDFSRVSVNIAMALVTPEKTIHCGRVRDISLNGICCECSETLPVGQQCRVVLFLGDPNDSVQVEAEARVVRSKSAGPEGTTVAVELSEINLESFHHICALVLNNASDELAVEQELRTHLGIRHLKQ